MATNADKLNELAVNMAQLITDFSGVKIQTAAMYKLLITGNGTKPLPEVVRNHEEWIRCRDLEKKEEETAKKDFKWKARLEVVKQVVYIIGLAVALWLGLH